MYSRRKFGLLASSAAFCAYAQQVPTPRTQPLNPRQATIRHFGAIDAQTMATLASLVDGYINQGISDIVLNISSPGGDVDAAISAYQYLRGRPITLTTHNFGTVDSAAVIVFAAGQRRFCTRLGRFLIHEVFFSGNNSEENETNLNEKTVRLRQETNVIAEVLAECTGKSEETAKGWIRNHVVWTAQDALNNKLVQEIRAELQVSGPVASIVGPSRTDTPSAAATR